MNYEPSLDFSIVLPAYNYVQLFRRTLESVRCQKDVSLEIIIVDDSNRCDDIEHYVTALSDSRIVYRHNHPSLGAVRNWNNGLAECHGRYIQVVHHDEAMGSDTFLKEVKERLQTNDVAVCNIEVHNADGNTYYIYNKGVKEFTIRFPALLFAINALGPCAVFAFRRSILETFDERTNWFVDVEWYYRLLKGHKATYLPSAVIHSLHGHKGQISNTIDTTAEARKDAQWLSQKYSSAISVRLAMWIQINILHNNWLHNVLKKLFRR